MPIINNKLNPIDNALSSTSEHPVQNKVVKGALDTKQDTLVGSGSGQNIKTINNESILGSGNISISVSQATSSVSGTIKLGDDTTIDSSQASAKPLQLNASGQAFVNVPSSEIDSNVLVEIETTASNDYANRTNYATAISLKQWIANCEAGNVYTEGTIAKVSNLISGKAFRLLLIGTNHEVLAYNDTTQAKTTWQFLDMPQHNVRLGLPFNLLDWDSGGNSRDKLMQYLNGINSSQMTLYPSNMNGLISAQGLLEACHTIFEALPDTLKRHIKTVRRYYYRKRNYMYFGSNGGRETNSGEMGQLACNVFHLAATDLGTGYAQANEGSGSKYTYFNADARRIRFYNGTATNWWVASSNNSYSNRWNTVSLYGNGDYSNTDYICAVAPAFCI